MRRSQPRGFEEQTVEAIRNLTVACVILAVGLLIAIGLAGWGFQRASEVNRSVSAGLLGQTSNRAGNVNVWCGAINQLQATLTGYVAAASRSHADVAPLRLVQLNCGQLAQATQKSARP